MIEGTPAITMTLPIPEAKHPDTLLRIRSAPARHLTNPPHLAAHVRPPGGMSFFIEHPQMPSAAAPEKFKKVKFGAIKFQRSKKQGIFT
jgi:hypothetical protein